METYLKVRKSKNEFEVVPSMTYLQLRVALVVHSPDKNRDQRWHGYSQVVGTDTKTGEKGPKFSHLLLLPAAKSFTFFGPGVVLTSKRENFFFEKTKRCTALPARRKRSLPKHCQKPAIVDVTMLCRSEKKMKL